MGRAYDLLRGYVNREYDRIRGVDFDDAQRELDESLQGFAPTKRTPPRPSPSQAAMPEQPIATKEERARKILGLEPECSFDDTRKAFEKLNKRGDPNRFPVGSVEREHAAAIQKSVQWAYGILTVNVDSIEKRFKSLEIE